MKNERLLPSILFVLSLALPAEAQLRPQDYTLDYDDVPVASNPQFVPPLEKADGADGDPWPDFLSQLQGFHNITWGLRFAGDAPHDEHADIPMVPASVQKLVTAAAAFKNLGPNAQFENYFEAKVSSQTHTATNVKFTVSGDPTWGHSKYETFDERINKVMSELSAKGVQTVSGEITIVTMRPELDQIARPEGWPERWTLQCMATMPSSFMINGNCGSIRVSSLTKAAWTTPGMDLPIHLNLKAASKNNLTIKAESDRLNRIVGYTISGGFHSASSSFHDPLQSSSALYSTFPSYAGTRYLKNLFLRALNQNGIAYVPSSVELDQDSSILVDLSSDMLKAVMSVAVKDSINAVLDRYYFETAQVMRTAEPNQASFAILRESINDEKLLNGVEIFDGCGLVVDDRMRADTMHAFLSGLRSKTYFSDFLSVLAIAGQAGTLANRMTGPLTNGKVFGKTGTINQVYNLVGYFQTPNDVFEPFAIFTSSHQSASQVKGMIDRLVTQFAGYNASRKLTQVDAH